MWGNGRPSTSNTSGQPVALAEVLDAVGVPARGVLHFFHDVGLDVAAEAVLVGVLDGVTVLVAEDRAVDGLLVVVEALDGLDAAAVDRLGPVRAGRATGGGGRGGGGPEQRLKGAPGERACGQAQRSGRGVQGGTDVRSNGKPLSADPAGPGGRPVPASPSRMNGWLARSAEAGREDESVVSADHPDLEVASHRMPAGL